MCGCCNRAVLLGLLLQWFAVETLCFAGQVVPACLVE